MEFPEAGIQCSREDCKQLDFLPVKCAFCESVFCKEHSPVSAHGCAKAPDNVVNEKRALESFKCSSDGCKMTDPVEMNCVVCEKHFCLAHRHHGCLDAEPSKSKKDKWRAPKEQFKKAKAETDKVIENKLKTTSNRALANKIKLMKLKRVAVGDNRIPVVERVFFSVAPPIGEADKSESKAVFVSREWSVGRAMDLIARRLKVENRNNVELSGPKLRLFNVEGEILASKMDVLLSALLNDGTLVDGDSLILELMTQEDLDTGKTTFLTDNTSLAKYHWVQ